VREGGEEGRVYMVRFVFDKTRWKKVREMMLSEVEMGD